IIVFFDLLYGTFFGTPYEAGLHNLVVGIAFFIIIFVSIYQAYRLQDVPFDEKKKIKTSLKLFFSRVMIFFLFIMIMAMILSIYFQNTIIERLIKLSLINLGALMFVLGPIILVLGPIFILLIFIIANAISSFFIKNLGEILIKEKNIKKIIFGLTILFIVIYFLNINFSFGIELSEGFNKKYFGIYHYDNILSNADIKTFEVLEYGYAKDKNHVYSYSNLISEADSETFQVVGGFFAKDKKNVFFKENKVNDADPMSFELIKNTKGFYGKYGKDKHSIFLETERISDVESLDE
ncbi:DKNYY domain-containing protein, partial [Candidatus Woesearchaeota archaeon]|nr:DKNYY domain-containing protein [Candidatus Woesearchaeota archaeon]